jgi:hypothetical protein
LKAFSDSNSKGISWKLLNFKIVMSFLSVKSNEKAYPSQYEGVAQEPLIGPTREGRAAIFGGQQGGPLPLAAPI